MNKNDIQDGAHQSDDHLVPLSDMYEDYFLDYASYVILERAVPDIADGLKPVQRRLLFALKQMDDGRFHKVANVIGQTMQYHPHGDAAIGDALIHLGQKDLLIDCQGNWGDVRTGDSAAAPRYIEARLTKFALDVLFNPQTTQWQLSYDGRKQEPISLPAKFPILLVQGVEGIAVGLSTKILPHNFVEVIKASIKLLEGKSVKLYPDFQTGGSIDVSDYQGGQRGGKVKVRAHIEKVDKKTLAIRELPFGQTTSSLIDSILKANDRGKIKIKKVVDNTAQEVEVLIDLHTGTSPDLTIDALYAFTNCEVSISPNACVIIENRPYFITVERLLETATQNTKSLLRQELEIKQQELFEKWHFASLEQIFIEKRIYRDIEECESWEEVLQVVRAGLKKYVAEPDDPKDDQYLVRLKRSITEEDLTRLTEIKIKRISKYNAFKATERIESIEQELKEVAHHLANLVAYTIAYYQNLLDKYGKGKERRTKITSFESIEATAVVANNAKLYVNRKEGFIGFGLKKDEFVADCSDIDDVIVFRKDGSFLVTRIADKVFVGKDIIHVAVWKKNDERTTYHLAYLDAGSGKTYVKRFHVKAITRDREYPLTKGVKGSRVFHFSEHPNGEAEVIRVQLSQNCRAKKKIFEFDFGDLAIKGRSSQGNILTKYPVKKISSLEVGQSTLGAIKVWLDEVSGRLNTEERGRFLGDFDTGDQILILFKDGAYEVADFDLTRHFNVAEILELEKFDAEKDVISAVYFEGEKGWTMVKRFQVETSSTGQRFRFITEHNKTKLLFATLHPNPAISFAHKTKSGKETEEIRLDEFIDIKGWKALGNKLSDQRVTALKDQSPDQRVPANAEKEEESASKSEKKEANGTLRPGDSIDFDMDDQGQGTLF